MIAFLDAHTEWIGIVMFLGLLHLIVRVAYSEVFDRPLIQRDRREKLRAQRWLRYVELKARLGDELFEQAVADVFEGWKPPELGAETAASPMRDDGAGEPKERDQEQSPTDSVRRSGIAWVFDTINAGITVLVAVSFTAGLLYLGGLIFAEMQESGFDWLLLAGALFSTGLGLWLALNLTADLLRKVGGTGVAMWLTGIEKKAETLQVWASLGALLVVCLLPVVGVTYIWWWIWQNWDTATAAERWMGPIGTYLAVAFVVKLFSADEQRS